MSSESAADASLKQGEPPWHTGGYEPPLRTMVNGGVELNGGVTNRQCNSILNDDLGLREADGRAPTELGRSRPVLTS